MAGLPGCRACVKVGPPFDVLFFVGLLLFVITMLLNVVGARFVARVRETY